MTLGVSCLPGILGGVVVGGGGDPDPFGDPTFGSPAYGGASSATSIICNTITCAEGDRIVLAFTQTRASTSAPTLGLASLISIVGTTGLAGLDFNISTGILATHSQTMAGNNAGARASLASLVVPEGAGGTGAFQVNWSKATYSTFAQAFVLPPCAVVDAMAAGATGAEATLPLTTSAELEAEDLAITVVSQMIEDTIVDPSGFTPSAIYTSGGNNAHRVAWRNGGVGSPITWSDLYVTSGTIPKAGAAAILRRPA